VSATVTPDEAREVAHTIKRQIGVMGLATVGASDFGFTYTENDRGGLSFKARLHVNGGSRARVCRVNVVLNGVDTYDIDVVAPGRSKYDAPTVVEVARGAYCDDLTRIMLNLDSNGVITR
jgi:hypothetical protein